MKINFKMEIPLNKKFCVLDCGEMFICSGEARVFIKTSERDNGTNANAFDLTNEQWVHFDSIRLCYPVEVELTVTKIK